jgi:hypothetical protein
LKERVKTTKKDTGRDTERKREEREREKGSRGAVERETGRFK